MKLLVSDSEEDTELMKFSGLLSKAISTINKNTNVSCHIYLLGIILLDNLRLFRNYHAVCSYEANHGTNRVFLNIFFTQYCTTSC